MHTDIQGLPGDRRFSAGKATIYVFVAIMALVYTLPLIVIVLTSLKDIEDVRTGTIA
jgi:glucose/mannose transport system permease protein